MPDLGERWNYFVFLGNNVGRYANAWWWLACSKFCSSFLVRSHATFSGELERIPIQWRSVPYHRIFMVPRSFASIGVGPECSLWRCRCHSVRKQRPYARVVGKCLFDRFYLPKITLVLVRPIEVRCAAISGGCVGQVFPGECWVMEV